MKRFICLMLVLSLLPGLSGCRRDSRLTEEAEFYYVRTDFSQSVLQGALASERRDITGHSRELSYLISLYLTGPMNEELAAIFPPETRLEALEKHDDTLKIILTETEEISASRFSLGAGGLAMTCFPLTDACTIQIDSGSHTIRLTRDSLFLEDNVIETIEGGTP